MHHATYTKYCNYIVHYYFQPATSCTCVYATPLLKELSCGDQANWTVQPQNLISAKWTDVVEKTGSVCRICYLHGKIADMDTPISSATHKLPVDNKVHYHTSIIPCQWNDSLLSLNPEIRLKIHGGLSTPNVKMHFFSPHTHQTQSRADNPMQNSTLPLHSYPPCAVQMLLVWGGKLFPVLLLRGRSKSPGTAERQAQLMQHLWCILVTIKQPLSSLNKLTPINEAIAHGNTHHICLIFYISTSDSLSIYYYYYVGPFLVQLVFGPLMLIGSTVLLMFLFRPTFGCGKYSHNAQLPFPANFKIHDLHFYGYSISLLSTGPKWYPVQLINFHP